MIVGILEKIGFKSTTHKRNLYREEIGGQMVLVCRQVDDFAIACKSRTTADKLIAHINEQVTTDNQGIGIHTVHGMSSWYNGINVHQTRDYIKLSCETYIDRVLQTHAWMGKGQCQGK